MFRWLELLLLLVVFNFLLLEKFTSYFQLVMSDNYRFHFHKILENLYYVGIELSRTITNFFL